MVPLRSKGPRLTWHQRWAQWKSAGMPSRWEEGPGAFDPGLLLKGLGTDSLTQGTTAGKHQGRTGGAEVSGFRVRPGEAASSLPDRSAGRCCCPGLRALWPHCCGCTCKIYRPPSDQIWSDVRSGRSVRVFASSTDYCHGCGASMPELWFFF